MQMYSLMRSISGVSTKAHTHQFVAVEIEHITTTDELVGSRSVEDGLGVDGRSYLEGDTAREVRLDILGDDAGGRTAGGDDHVDAHGIVGRCGR